MAAGKHLLRPALAPILPRMFVVTEAEAAAIRAAFDQGGELAAAIEGVGTSLRSATPHKGANAPGRSRAGNR